MHDSRRGGGRDGRRPRHDDRRDYRPDNRGDMRHPMHERRPPYDGRRGRDEGRGGGGRGGQSSRGGQGGGRGRRGGGGGDRGPRRPRDHYDVIGVGYTTLDTLAIVPDYPAENSKCELKELTREGGGPTATALVTLARLGVSTCFIGKMGDDDAGHSMRRELDREGVDTCLVRLERGATSQSSFIVVNEKTGDRTIFWSRGTVTPMRGEEIERDWIGRGRVLHLDTHELAVAVPAAQWARDAGMEIVLDAGTPREGIEEVLPLVDYVIGSETFATAFTGESDLTEASRKILAMGPQVVVTTQGAKGCFAVTHDRVIEVPGHEVEAVDTTGAGDVFHGAFSYGLLQHWDLEEILGFANAAAALKCRSLGGRRGIPRLAEVNQFRRPEPEPEPVHAETRAAAGGMGPAGEPAPMQVPAPPSPSPATSPAVTPVNPVNPAPPAPPAASNHDDAQQPEQSSSWGRRVRWDRKRG